MPICETYETEALKIVQNVLKIDGPFSMQSLSGGLSGSTLIKVNTPNHAFVVRFWNLLWAADFPQDFSCQMIASNAGYGPHVFFIDQTACITVMEYFHSEIFPEVPIRLLALVDLLKKIHSGPTVPKGIDKATDLDESIEDLIKLNPQFINLDDIKAIKEAVFTATHHSAYCVPCHRDLHPGNLIYTQGRFFAIDYTWGGMDDPYIDLAALAIFNCVTEEDEKNLLKLYLGHMPTSLEIARLSLIKQLTKIFYGLEFLKLTAPSTITNTTKAIPKNYMNFGCCGESLLNTDDFLGYAISILNEVLEYSRSEQYSKNLNLLQK